MTVAGIPRVWQLGDFSVHEVRELRAPVGLFNELIPQATRELVSSVEWLYPHFADESGRLAADFHSYVIDTGTHTILVDAGCGNGKNHPLQPLVSHLDTDFIRGLQRAGFAVTDIDFVLITHLHLDHVGWCATKDHQGRWSPTFPHARVVVIDGEYERHLAQITPARGKQIAELSTRQAAAIQEESLQPIIDAGQLDLVQTDTEVVAGIRFLATPGHTLTHHSVRVDSRGQAGVITGDFIHHPVQIARPEWSSRGDDDPQMSARTRRSFLLEAAKTDVLVLGSHFAGPGGGWVEPDERGFRLTQT